MVLAKGFTVAAEDIRHFQPATATGPVLRNVAAGSALARLESGGGVGPAGWTRRRPYWWRSADIGPWWPDCDGQATVEWCGHRCRIRADGQQRRVAANAE